MIIRPCLNLSHYFFIHDNDKAALSASIELKNRILIHRDLFSGSRIYHHSRSEVTCFRYHKRKAPGKSNTS
ncbi:hypothetical protein PNOK_0695100 [Pyrrhoderma noxium]|uniref:Uncharacterized protein n=1 Tax=Pyrrhoderma noxium TaxID=2282107 RepID=A0A286UBF4_9AGAM|nr:hypothetical protein PNOK_0695100 [Pyrrhoderma noxium]